ncbi:hypothetical protein Zm00014a_012606 [Zea mays]|jgi:hypothetical protein|uniref:Uncharacterized protein n=2 Tax=Zea mays TaxID=4577 RepID=B6UCB9_MAIZE|nr:uncharacterized protein LOC100278694 [Zea mays]ACG47002.1 hypothetical protein [Zea mays]AQK84827.1 hypothetical protein ZEAMMB73_Zm00001d037806 [Zea mays]PWZ16638.1 hypothetical protein Zm00014a_012606 [Zea mays]|eukprot:NP_001145358.1 uncharacterized protein LOC100278694 [Zea mays]
MARFPLGPDPVLAIMSSMARWSSWRKPWSAARSTRTPSSPCRPQLRGVVAGGLQEDMVLAMASSVIGIVGTGRRGAAPRTGPILISHHELASMREGDSSHGHRTCADVLDKVGEHCCATTRAWCLRKCQIGAQNT